MGIIENRKCLKQLETSVVYLLLFIFALRSFCISLVILGHMQDQSSFLVVQDGVQDDH